jgi:predicted transcriptional regulator
MQEESMKLPAISSRSKRRSPLQLIAEILENAKVGSTKTRMMYKVGMSHSQLNRYLEFLGRSSMIENDKGIYRATSKGLAFVEKFKALDFLFC